MKRWGFLMVLMLAACGGSQATGGGGTTTPKEGGDEEAAEPKKVSTMVSPEAYDEINAFFKKKRAVVTQCQVNAIENGKLDKKAGGRVTMEMVISAQGKPEGVKVAQTTLQNSFVEDCLVKMVGNWQVPAPGTGVNFSFSYDFHAE
jgi:hypothetical protein